MKVDVTEIRDLGRLMRWRAEVIRCVFGEEPSPALLEANREYYEHSIADGSHRAYVAGVGGEECGCGAICFSRELPSPDNPSGRCAYLMNIYVRKAYRHHGVAHAVVSRLIREARKTGCGKIYLESTEEGRPVYASLGFRDMPDMMKYYEEEH